MTTATSPLRGPLRKRDSHLWQRDEFDFYTEPSWTSERLFAEEPFAGSIWDPACGSGRIIASARAAGLRAGGSDIVARVQPAEFIPTDFLSGGTMWADNVVCNPPFGKAQEFVDRALAITRHKVAMLLPAIWMLGDRRSRWLEATPLCRVWLLTPRPSMPPGAVVSAGGPVGGGIKDYAWYIWDQGFLFLGAPTLCWLRKNP